MRRRGSCLCGALTYAIEGELAGAWVTYAVRPTYSIENLTTDGASTTEVVTRRRRRFLASARETSLGERASEGGADRDVEVPTFSSPTPSTSVSDPISPCGRARSPRSVGRRPVSERARAPIGAKLHRDVSPGVVRDEEERAATVVHGR